MILRNLSSNPSFETSTAGWEPWTAGVTLTRMAVAGGASHGSGYLRLYVVDDKTTVGAAHSMPATPGPVSAAVDARLIGMSGYPDASARLRFDFRDATGVRIGGYYYGPITLMTTGAYRQLTASVVAPAGAVTANLVVQVVDGSGSTGWLVPAGTGLYIDALMVTAGDTPEQYRDGSTAGWKWDGAAQLSTSRGPRAPYAPDASVYLQGTTLVEHADQMAGYESHSDGIVTVTPVRGAGGANPYHVVAGPRVPRTGRLVLRFTRELGWGTPAERSRALELQLRGGFRMQLRPRADVHGIPTFDFYATAVTRRMEPATAHKGRDAVWTVECDFADASI